MIRKSKIIKVVQGPDEWALITSFFLKAGYLENRPTVSFVMDPEPPNTVVKIIAEVRGMHKLDQNEILRFSREHGGIYDLKLQLRVLNCSHCVGTKLTMIYSLLTRKGVIIQSE